jgi:hypothetical protein
MKTEIELETAHAELAAARAALVKRDEQLIGAERCGCTR